MPQHLSQLQAGAHRQHRFQQQVLRAAEVRRATDRHLMRGAPGSPAPD
ncbi:hypothetical protein ABT168_00400 [Streptomyces sp. NPDC001793]